MPEFIAFFAAIPFTDVSFCEATLVKYKIGRYVIARETSQDTHLETSGEHLHFCVEMDLKDYTNYAKRVFIDKYKLRGKATQAGPRQYGKVKDIRDIDKMLSYTVKEKNYISNFDCTSYEVLSYSKENPIVVTDKKVRVKVKTWSEKLTDKIKEEYPDREWEFRADDIMLLREQAMLYLGQSSKKLNGGIIRDIVFGQLNALSPNNKQLQAYIDFKAFPDMYSEMQNYFK